ncbi:MAG: C39 family peptidase [Bacteroidota bacterium]|nr:C39 family peptidase [Bacteroidota bacterium]
MKKFALWLLLATLYSGCSEKIIKVFDFPNTRQSFDYSCGPGAVQAVMAYYGKEFRESELIDLLKTDKTDGTLVKEIVRFLNSQGLSVDVKEHMTKDELLRYVDKKIPVITLIQAWGSEADFNNHYKETWNDGHFVVVIGYTRNDVICSDPALFKKGYIPLQEFIDRWHDYDEGETKTYQLGLAVYGMKPAYEQKSLERIK